MTEILKARYDIVVLKVELLDVARSEPDVRFTLQAKVDGQLTDVGQWPGHTGAMGLRETFDTRKIAAGDEPQIVLPGELESGLAAWFHAATDGGRPLWVHLVKPYGPLRLVPWERLLGYALGLPILMLPDFIFPPPREAPTTLDVVLCGSAPLGSEESSVYQCVRQAAQCILDGSPRRNRLHVFVDAHFAGWLRDEWHAAGRLDSEIFVYDAALAEPYVVEDPSSRMVDQAGMLRSPWLLWMREALRGRAVDVVHFCCHGYLSRGRGALLFAQSPLDRSDRYLAGPVGMVELQTFLTQVGAWSSAFSSLPDNFSSPGLRALADEVAQNRPGPMLMHDLRADPGGGALAAGYRFLYANAPEPPPCSPALFMYCQPYLSLGNAGVIMAPRAHRAVAPAFAELARNTLQELQVPRSNDFSPLDPVFGGDEDVPSWVAATERYAEQVQLHYQELARDELLPMERGAQQTDLVMATLDRLRSAVADEAAYESAPLLGRSQ